MSHIRFCWLASWRDEIWATKKGKKEKKDIAERNGGINVGKHAM